jgi:hypothetical protein
MDGSRSIRPLAAAAELATAGPIAHGLFAHLHLFRDGRERMLFAPAQSVVGEVAA